MSLVAIEMGLATKPSRSCLRAGCKRPRLSPFDWCRWCLAESAEVNHQQWLAREALHPTPPHTPDGPPPSNEPPTSDFILAMTQIERYFVELNDSRKVSTKLLHCTAEAIRWARRLSAGTGEVCNFLEERWWRIATEDPMLTPFVPSLLPKPEATPQAKAKGGCAICGTDTRQPILTMTGPYPYCPAHERELCTEWVFCRHSDILNGRCTAWASAKIGFCSLHNGEDYKPRTEMP